MMAATLPLEIMPMAHAGTWKTLIGVLTLAMLAGGLVWWARAVDWPIEVVRIDGPVRHTDRERMKSIMARHAEAGFAAMDLTALRRELVDLPWVREASLRRVWPDTLRVEVREHEPVAVWNDDALVSDEGVVFRPAEFSADDLARLEGPKGQGGEMLERLRAFEQRLAPLGLKIAGLEQDARRAWRLTLGNGIVLRLGRDRVAERLARFRAVWSGVLKPRAERIAAVDLRYTNGFAVAWRDGEQPQAPGGEA
ncbi:MAG: cell division protein FtsQ/DivIB [Halofilum sp. (in: g-proteobacteria)]|nr:cell division protein FtsQ/DivIB [Halofilum sp. (in: g-proteobacteria)]